MQRLFWGGAYSRAALFQVNTVLWKDDMLTLSRAHWDKAVVVGHGPKGMVDRYISQSRTVS